MKLKQKLEVVKAQAYAEWRVALDVYTVADQLITAQTRKEGD